MINIVKDKWSIAALLLSLVKPIKNCTVVVWHKRYLLVSVSVVIVPFLSGGVKGTDFLAKQLINLFHGSLEYPGSCFVCWLVFNTWGVALLLKYTVEYST